MGNERVKHAVEFMRSELEGFLGLFEVRDGKSDDVILVGELATYRAYLPEKNSPSSHLETEYVSEGVGVKRIPWIEKQLRL